MRWLPVRIDLLALTRVEGFRMAMLCMLLTAAGSALAVALPEPELDLPRCPMVMPGSQSYGLEGDSRGPFECFGACGPSCEHQGCSEVAVWTARTTLTGADGRPYCRSCQYRARTCGTHAACRWHDAAILGCGAEYPNDSTWNEIRYVACKRTADAMMAAEYDPVTLAGWASGRGPTDGTIRYTELAAGDFQPGPCD